MVVKEVNENMIARDVVKSLVVLTSDSCTEAVDEVIKLASSSRSKTVVYLKYVEDSDPTLNLYLKKEDFDKKRWQAQEICTEQSKRIMDAGLEVEVLPPYFGIAAEEIARVEKQIGLDIIVIAAPERSTYQRILNGAHFSEDVIRRVMTPTLIIKPAPARRVRITESRKDAEKVWPGANGIDKAALAKGY